MSSNRREFFPRSFAFRLALWYGVLFCVSVAILGALTYVLLAASLEQRDREIIESTMARYAAAYERAGVSALAGAIQVDQAAGRYERLFVRALGAGRDVIFLSMPDDWSAFELAQLPTPTSRGPTWSQVPAGPPDEVLEVVSARLSDGALFQVGKSTALRADLLARFRRVLVTVFLAIVATAIVGGGILTYSALEPLRHLSRVVTEILRTGKVDARVPVRENGDTLDDLSALFNRMLDRVALLIDAMRGALDNVAHDLRTPMMRLRATIEGALNQETGDPARQRESLADCLEESDRMMEMLDTLMDISEAETGTLRLNIEHVNLSSLMRSAADLYEDAAEDKGVELAVLPGAPVEVEGDRNRLRQVLANLLDNAVKYTPPGGRVEIGSYEHGDAVEIVVRDTGPGIAAHELPRIWERLYRGDSTRSVRGLGLGLSLVKAIVEAHQGRVDGVPLEEGGMRFTIQLPRRRTGHG
jgi:signal transduction histidine kinase